MASRCGCAGSTCACKVEGGAGVDVTGTGTVQDPYVVAITDLEIGDLVEVDDTTTVNLTKLGSGTDSDPIVLSATVVTGSDVTSTPSNGGSTNIDDDTNLQYFDHSGTIASHTINLPDTTNSFLKEVTFVFRSIITTLTVAAPGTTDVAGMPTTVAANGYFKVRLIGTTWRRVG